MPEETRLRIAALGDTHCGKVPADTLAPLFAQVNDRADVLVLCGDLTDHGLPEEAAALARLLAAVRVPMVGVLGNHDYHGGKVAEVTRILTHAGLQLLDGEPVEVRGVGFAGAKGFLGGFGRGTLEPWGEDMVKQMVHESVEEAVKLGSGLAKLRTARRVAVLHYAPIRETVEGEPPEIFPFLGCSRLEEPLHRYGVSVVFHGHAHRGSPEGRLRKDVPVFNVALPLLQRTFPDRPEFRVYELTVPAPDKTAAATVV
jgi:Icc-related predicted phosphoesterase